MDAYTVGEDGALLARLANGTEERVGELLPASDAGEVLSLLNRAAHHQDSRRYTASARLYAQADALVTWDEAAP